VNERRVAIASDHAGFELKQSLVAELDALGCEAVDLGTHDVSSVDYPDYADRLATALAAGEAESGVLVCGTGIGISMAANRHRHIRAAVAHDVTSARLARLHNDANVLALGARLIGIETARDCLKVFLDTSFEGGRHQRRVDKLTRLPTAL
jgi:ribose 5-phosphate isomerase B